MTYYFKHALYPHVTKYSKIEVVAAVDPIPPPTTIGGFSVPWTPWKEDMASHIQFAINDFSGEMLDMEHYVVEWQNPGIPITEDEFEAAYKQFTNYQQRIAC